MLAGNNLPNTCFRSAFWDLLKRKWIVEIRFPDLVVSFLYYSPCMRLVLSIFYFRLFRVPGTWTCCIQNVYIILLALNQSCLHIFVDRTTGCLMLFTRDSENHLFTSSKDTILLHLKFCSIFFSIYIYIFSLDNKY